MSSVESTTRPDALVWQVSASLVPARALHLIAELGVANLVDEDPVDVQKLASALGVDASSLDRVLRLLVSVGIFRRDADGYRHTDASRLLRDDHPMSMRVFARLMGLPVVWSSVASLESSVRTGEPAIDSLEPGGLWAYLESHPAEGRIFDEAMTARAQADTAGVVSTYDFGTFGTIADIGGGRGHLVRAILQSVPTARGVLFDLPLVIDTLDRPPDRLVYQSGDFFADSLPVADAYLLMDVLHDWADKEAAAILVAIRRAAAMGAVVLIIESIVREDNPDPAAHTLDLIMLTMFGGRERTVSELRRLLDGCSFRLNRVLETGGPRRIVEAVAV